MRIVRRANGNQINSVIMDDRMRLAYKTRTNNTNANSSALLLHIYLPVFFCQINKFFVQNIDFYGQSVWKYVQRYDLLFIEAPLDSPSCHSVK